MCLHRLGCARVAESGNALVLSFAQELIIDDAKKQTSSLRGFRARIPTLANFQFADKQRVENIEPHKQKTSKNTEIGCGFRVRL